MKKRLAVLMAVLLCLAGIVCGIGEYYAVFVAGVFGLVILLVVQRNRKKLKWMDHALLSRDELFSKLSSNVDDVFIMLGTKDLNVDYISPNIDRLMGLSKEEVFKDIRAIAQLETGEAPLIDIEHLKELQPNEQMEWDKEYMHQRTGEVRLFHVVAFCSDIQGEKKYIVDMSDRTNDRKMNQALKEAVQTAENASRAKSTFLSSMSHDIRTPMNAIIGFATLAAANVTNTDKVKDYLTKILSSGNHLLSLINDVLDMSRIESGKIHLEEQEANLSDIFHDIKTIIGGQIHAKQLDLYMDILDVTDENVFCDKTRLNQVLLNLLSNAVKFTPPCGAISVRVTQLPNAPEGKARYEIRVKDTGIGMSPEFAARIFEPFEREHTSTVSKIQGTGLGMAISKNIIDMMGGTIEVYTELGKGTEFVINLTLRLQLQRRRVEKMKELEGLKALVVDDDFNTCDSVTSDILLTSFGQQKPKSHSLLPDVSVLKDKHLLLVEDNELNREIALEILGEYGLCIDTAENGAEAVEKIEAADAGTYDLVLMDIQMPVMDGYEATSAIRALENTQKASVPILAMTANAFDEDRRMALEKGMNGFLSKPIQMEELIQTLQEVLGK